MIVDLVGDVVLVERGPFALLEVVLTNMGTNPVVVRKIVLRRDRTDITDCYPADRLSSDDNFGIEQVRFALQGMRAPFSLPAFPIVVGGNTAQNRIEVSSRRSPYSEGGIFDGVAGIGSQIHIDQRPGCERRGWLAADLSSCEGDYGGDWSVRAETET